MASFEKLTVYQKSLDFIQSVYEFTDVWPKSELFGLTSQIRRAAVSISLNIAEGSSRSPKDFKHFLTISRGSCYECIALLSLSKRLHFISEKIYESKYSEAETLAKMINGLMKSLDK